MADILKTLQNKYVAKADAEILHPTILHGDQPPPTTTPKIKPPPTNKKGQIKNTFHCAMFNTKIVFKSFSLLMRY